MLAKLTITDQIDPHQSIQSKSQPYYALFTYLYLLSQLYIQVFMSASEADHM